MRIADHHVNRAGRIALRSVRFGLVQLQRAMREVSRAAEDEHNDYWTDAIYFDVQQVVERVDRIIETHRGARESGLTATSEVVCASEPGVPTTAERTLGEKWENSAGAPTCECDAPGEGPCPLHSAPDQSMCPKCSGWVADYDGFGVLRHEACGYCAHPSSDRDDTGRWRCGLCGVVTEPQKSGQVRTSGEPAEAADETVRENVRHVGAVESDALDWLDGGSGGPRATCSCGWSGLRRGMMSTAETDLGNHYRSVQS